MRRTPPSILLIALATALVALACMPTLAFAKSYSVPNVEVLAHVTSDGVLEITEARTVDFSGAFTRVVWRLSRAQSSGIDVISVHDDAGTTYAPTTDPAALDTRPPGTYLVTDTGDALEVSVFHRTSDAKRTFTITYVVRGAAKRWADTGEFYWKLLGDESDVGVGEFRATVQVDGVTSRDQVKAWAHGPLNGVVAIDANGLVTLSARNVAPNTYVEVRETFPAAALSGVPASVEAKAAIIASEEAKLANAANSTRRAARVKVAFWIGLPGLFAIAALILVIRWFLAHGREHRAKFAGTYFRDDPRPELHPAVIDAVWRMGTVDNAAIGATLMNLADIGVVTLEPSDTGKTGLGALFGSTKTYKLTRVREKLGKAVPLDLTLLGILFDQVAGGADELLLSDIAPYAKANPESFTEAIKEWKASASAEAETLGFFEPESRNYQIGTFLLAAGVFALAVWAVFSVGFWALAVPVPAVIAMIVLGVFMARRSQQGNELYRTYVGVRNYLRDFSRLEEAPPASVILWNRFLVLAVVFGVAEKVIEQLRVTLPQVASDPAFQTTYWWVYAGPHGSAPIGELDQSVTSAFSAATSAMSSASGGGGGFSGGGGFGGGGGGFGAD